MSSQPASPIAAVGRIVICDYNALLLSVTGLLRMTGYQVFQAYDGQAAAELCVQMPDISLLVLNTYGTGVDTPTLVRDIRTRNPRLPVLHIGKAPIPGMPSNVVDLHESFTADQLLEAVRDLVAGAPGPRLVPDLIVSAASG
jgi:CheY-like chemotaxis protein